MIRISLDNLTIEPNTKTVTSDVTQYCPFCLNILRKNGYARRIVKDVHDLVVTTQVYYLQCYICTTCSTRHRLLPEEWIPLRQYTASSVQTILTTHYPIWETSLIRQQARLKSL